MYSIVPTSYSYYFVIDYNAVHVAVIHKNETFASPGEVREADEIELKRIIKSCGTLSFIAFGDTISVFTQTRHGVSRLHTYRYDECPQSTDISGFLIRHANRFFA